MYLFATRPMIGQKSGPARQLSRQMKMITTASKPESGWCAAALCTASTDRASIDHVCMYTQELWIYKRLGLHPNLPKRGPVYENTEMVSIMLTYASKGRLLTFLATWPTISEEDIAHFLDQLLTALEHCHSHGMFCKMIKAFEYDRGSQQSDCECMLHRGCPP